MSSAECDLTSTSLFAVRRARSSRRTRSLGVTYDVSRPRRLPVEPVPHARSPTTASPPSVTRDWRTRQAVAASLRYFFPRSQTTLIGAYRFYRDNWEVHAHTPEVRVIQASAASPTPASATAITRRTAVLLPGPLLDDGHRGEPLPVRRRQARRVHGHTVRGKARHPRRGVRHGRTLGRRPVRGHPRVRSCSTTGSAMRSSLMSRSPFLSSTSLVARSPRSQRAAPAAATTSAARWAPQPTATARVERRRRR